MSGMSNSIVARIKSFRCVRGQLFAERRNRGYTLRIPVIVNSQSTRS